MRPIHRTLAVLLAVALAGGAVIAWQGTRLEGAPPAPPVDPGGVRGLLYARPFVLDTGYEHSWRAERPYTTAGWLLVLEADAARVHPRELLEPVLYVEGDVAERVNRGWPSGHLVVIAPAPEGPDGRPAPLSTLRAWFGPPALPEQIDQEAVTVELARADQAGIQSFPNARFEAARTRGGALLELEDHVALERLAAELVLEYAPEDAALANSILLPLNR